jgi:hypothetical protein
MPRAAVRWQRRGVRSTHHVIASALSLSEGSLLPLRISYLDSASAAADARSEKLMRSGIGRLAQTLAALVRG